MKIVIRDDDTCGFTSPEELNSCYESIWRGMPVSLSVTPFRIPGKDHNLPKHLLGNMDVIPLEVNTDLVAYLKEGISSGKIDVSLHGYHHLRYKGLPEFISGGNLSQRAKKGKAYLENIFQIKVCSFVPPNNSIARRGIQAVVDAGMNLVGVPSLWSPKSRKISIKTIINMPAYYWHEKVRQKKYPYILDSGDHKEVAFHTAGPNSDFKALVNELEYCRDRNGIYVLSTHYHAFERTTRSGDSVRKILFTLLDRAAGYPSVEFVGINSIW